MRRFVSTTPFFTLLLIVVGLLFPRFSYAIDLSSTNFIIRDPVVGTGGGYGSSASFSLFSSGNMNLSGRGSSASFFGHYGFLYFPFVSDVVLTSTPTGADVGLSWPAAESTEGLGWTVGGYNTGIASVSGGPYTYTDVGNVTTYTYEDLTPGEYCFILQTYDALDHVIATSNEECETIQPTITFDIDTPSGGGNGESSAPYSVDLGTITTNDTRVSGAGDGVQTIVLEGTTNAPSGIVIIVRNANGTSGIVSPSVPTDNINSSDGTMADGTENYGLCVATSGLTGFSRASPYSSGSCALDTETNDIQALTTTGENILSAAGVLSNGHAEVVVNGAISTTTPAHSDYTDTLTFIAVPTF